MFVRKLNVDDFENEYNTLCQHLYPWKDKVDTPFGSMFCIVEPGNTTKLHNHHEGETFFILQGKGVFHANEESTDVGMGDVIYLQPFIEHQVHNTSTEERLYLITVYWEDMKSASEQAKQVTSKASTISAPYVFITSPAPCANGDLHLGHLSGPYLGADIYRRYQQMRGRRTYHLCGSDDNQGYVALKAQQLGISPQQLAKQSGDAIHSTLTAAKIPVDLFLRPNTFPDYTEFVHDFFLKLYREGKIVLKETASFYCECCEKYLFQAYIVGQCPQCGASSEANSCETCGRSNHPDELVDPRCKVCEAKPVERPLEKFYFKLKPYEQKLRDYYKTVKMDSHLMAICEQSLEDGLPDRPITHLADWGVTVPVKGFENQRLDAWIEFAAGGHLFAADKLSQGSSVLKGWKDFWASSSVDIVQFFGFDNGYFYAVLFPTLFWAYDEAIEPPKVFVSNEFYLLDGEKFSTSRGHAVWGKEFLEEFPADLMRFYLAYTRPEVGQMNFSRVEFEQTVKQTLLDQWNSWLQGVHSRLMDEYDGVLPEPGAWTDKHRMFYQELNRCVEDISSAYNAETFSPQKATRVLCELVRMASSFGQSEAALSKFGSKKEERRTAIALEFAAVKILALLAAPLMPEFALSLWNYLGYEQSIWDGTWEETLHFVPSNRLIETPPPQLLGSVAVAS
jgi:methionyl-tRNA synthetase